MGLRYCSSVIWILKMKEVTDQETFMAEMGDELCEYCPWVKGKIDHRCDDICEGIYCYDAFDEYQNQNYDL